MSCLDKCIGEPTYCKWCYMANKEYVLAWLNEQMIEAKAYEAVINNITTKEELDKVSYNCKKIEVFSE